LRRRDRRMRQRREKNVNSQNSGNSVTKNSLLLTPKKRKSTDSVQPSLLPISASRQRIRTEKHRRTSSTSSTLLCATTP